VYLDEAGGARETTPAPNPTAESPEAETDEPDSEIIEDDGYSTPGQESDDEACSQGNVSIRRSSTSSGSRDSGIEDELEYLAESPPASDRRPKSSGGMSDMSAPGTEDASSPDNEPGSPTGSSMSDVDYN